MRKSYFILVMVAVLSLVITTTALADNPKFKGAATASVVGNSIVITGQATGLGNPKDYKAVADAEGTAEWVCRNRGGNGNKASAAFAISAVGNFQQDHSGLITYTVTINLTPPPTAGTCSASGKNWTMVLVSATGSGDVELRSADLTVLYDTTNFTF